MGTLSTATHGQRPPASGFLSVPYLTHSQSVRSALTPDSQPRMCSVNWHLCSHVTQNLTKAKVTDCPRVVTPPPPPHCRALLHPRTILVAYIAGPGLSTFGTCLNFAALRLVISFLKTVILHWVIAFLHWRSQGPLQEILIDPIWVKAGNR